MPTTYRPFLLDPPTADIQRLLSVRRAFRFCQPVTTGDLAALWDCSQLLASARLTRLHRLGLATVRQAGPATFLILPRSAE